MISTGLLISYISYKALKKVDEKGLGFVSSALTFHSESREFESLI